MMRTIIITYLITVIIPVAIFASIKEARRKRASALSDFEYTMHMVYSTPLNPTLEQIYRMRDSWKELEKLQDDGWEIIDSTVTAIGCLCSLRRYRK